MLQAVSNSLACRLNYGPEFQVFGAVIRLHSINVMNIFAIQKRSSKHLRHDKSMLKYVFAATTGIGVPCML